MPADQLQEAVEAFRSDVFHHTSDRMNATVVRSGLRAALAVMPDAPHGTNIPPLTKLEIAASLAAVRAVADSMSSATGGTSLPLTTAAEKFQKALDELNGDDDA